MARQIFAGGGSSSSNKFVPHNKLLRYIVSSLRGDSSRRIRVGLLTTGSRLMFKEESAYSQFVDLHLRRFRTAGADPYVIEERTPVLHCDLLYATGGDTCAALSQWQDSGIDRLIRREWEEGDLSIGGDSLGGMCWFEHGDTDSAPGLSDGQTTFIECLGLIPGAFSPHKGERGSVDELRARLLGKSIPECWAVAEDSLLHLTDSTPWSLGATMHNSGNPILKVTADGEVTPVFDGLTCLA